MPTLLVTHADVMAFAAASHDVSPLHVDAEYARRTSFGRPVVHGVRALLGAMSFVAPRGEALAKITADFQGPVFEDVPCTVSIDDKGAKVKVSVHDGTRLLMRATLVFAAGTPAELAPSTAARPRTIARGDVVEVGPAVNGLYAPERAGVDALVDRLGLRARGIASGHVAAMMAGSYVVGMERPGEQALFSRLQLSFGNAAPAAIRADVTSFDDRFQMIEMEVELCGAKGEIRALVRPRPLEIDAARIEAAIGTSAPLAGRTAVVIGAGRGLGAAIALALAKAGARVVGTYAAAKESADRLAALDARLSLVQADASSGESAARIGDALGDAPIDLIVLSASPPVLPLGVSRATSDRVRAFVDSSLAMALVPLVGLGARLAKGAAIVGISSTYATEPPEDFAHYAAAKGALEGLLRGFAKDRGAPLVIVRPPRVLTDMTNTAFGTEDALRAEDVAARIVQAVVAHAEGVTVVESFG